MTRSRNKRSGQALVEASLIMLVFIVVLVGIADFGQFLYLHQSLIERTRAATRYGAVHTYSNSGLAIKKVAVYNDAAAADGATPMLPNLTTDMVTATLSDAGTDSARITVTISNYPFNFISPYMSKSTYYRTVLATEPYEIP